MIVCLLYIKFRWFVTVSLKRSILSIEVALFFSSLILMNPAQAAIVDQCPAYAKNSLYRQTMEYYGYRLKPQVEKYGCRVIPVYSAFAKNHDIMIELAEEDSELMQRLIGIMEAVPELAEALHNNPALIQALELRLTNEEAVEEFWSVLEKINTASVQAILRKQPEIAALTLLLPNVSPKYLQKNFSRDQLRLLQILISHTGLTSSLAEVEGMEELLPFITTNPADSLSIYKKVLETWGNNRFERFAQETPQAVSAAVPPLTQASLKNLNPLNSQPSRFHRMQEEYIQLFHDLYTLIDHEQGGAWAAEFCMAFADILPLALLGPDISDTDRIRQFLIDLSRSEFFSKIIKPSACSNETNVVLLGNLIANASVAEQPLSSRMHPFTALADWHADGTLMPLIQIWVPFTSPKNFNLSLKEEYSSTDASQNQWDLLFWKLLVRLAMIRAELAPEQQKLFDRLSQDLMHKDIHPAVALAFLEMVNEPLFRIMQPGKYHHPYEVAKRLLLAGYPESTDLSLYEAFCRQEAWGQKNLAMQAIEKRGSLPEGEILVDGQSFADRHGGWTVMDITEAIDIAMLAASIAATITTYGAASPTVAAAAARIGIKQAARQAAKLASKAVAKGIRVLPEMLRPIVINSGKITRDVLKGYIGMPGKGVGIKIGDRSNKIVTGIITANALYSFLNPKNKADLPELMPLEICPGKEREE